MLLQLEYAALDAVVLIHIFRHVGDHQQPVITPDENLKPEWKSRIVSIHNKIFPTFVYVEFLRCMLSTNFL